VVEGDRLDNLAARFLGDPLLCWMICDANGAQYICYPSPVQGRKAWVLDALLPATQVAFRWTFCTTDDGTGPDACNHAGYFLDDFKVYGWGWP
jgi:hypothetical protein